MDTLSSSFNDFPRTTSQITQEEIDRLANATLARSVLIKGLRELLAKSDDIAENGFTEPEPTMSTTEWAIVEDAKQEAVARARRAYAEAVKRLTAFYAEHYGEEYFANLDPVLRDRRILKEYESIAQPSDSAEEYFTFTKSR